MSATELERMEALLRGDVPRTAAEVRRSALIGELRGGTLRAPDALRARALADRPEPARRPRPSWKLAFVVVPAALAVAVGAALVHGLTRPANNEQSASFGTVAPKTKAAADQQALRSAAAPSVAGTSGRLTHTDASITVAVPDTDDLRDATNEATRIATSLGGFAQSVEYRTPAEGGGASYLELRIPAQNVQRALAQLAGLGTLVSQDVSVKDLQHDLAVQSEQIAQLRRRVAALKEALQSSALPEAQRVLLQIKLAEAKRALAQRLNARKGTLAAGATSRVSLVINTEKAGAVPAQRSRIDRMLHSALGFLAVEGIVALYALIVVSPLLVVGVVVWWLARLRRRRDEHRLLAA